MKTPESLLTELRAEIDVCTLDDADEQQAMIELLTYYAEEVRKLSLPESKPVIHSVTRAEYNACRARVEVV